MLRMLMWILSITTISYATTAFKFTDPTLISSTYNAGVLSSVCNYYNLQTDTALLTWADTSQNGPYFSLYNFSTGQFSTPSLISSSYTGGVLSDVYGSYNFLNNLLLISWPGPSGQGPYYSIYNFNTGQFSTPIPINSNYTALASLDVYSSYNFKNNQAFLAWGDSTVGNLYYAIYDYPSQSMSGPFIMSNTYAFGGELLCSSYISQNNTAFITWSDQKNQNIWYAIYDFNLGVISQGPTIINPNYITSSNNTNSVTNCYNPVDNTVFVCWGVENFIPAPLYTVYNVKSGVFSNPAPISQAYMVGVSYDVSLSYNSRENTVFLSWADATNSAQPWYSVYNCKSKTFTPATLISPNYKQGVTVDVISSSDFKDNVRLLTWANFAKNGPYFSIYYNVTSILQKHFQDIIEPNVHYQKGVR